MRFFDADGVATTDTTVDNETAEFTLEEAGADDEIIVKTSSNDPDATTLKVETNKKSDDFTVFAFDIDTDDSTNDIELTEVVVYVDVSSSTYGNIVDDAELVIDGVKISDVDVEGNASSTAILTFNVDGDVVIDAGDRVEVELVLTFKSLAAGNEGTTVQAYVNADGDIDGEGADDVTSTGTATGDEHTLRTEGAVIEFVSSTETLKLNSDATTTDDSGTFVLKFDVTAFDTDLFINKTAASGTAMGTVGVNYQVTDGSGTVVNAGTPTQSLSSDAKTVYTIQGFRR
ncbi:hypothetical protein H6784_02895 [Candidatus Nomurabacteria bacterium]|nr:hypothetical protein [Candidatus Nomurabacteria bacterium]